MKTRLLSFKSLLLICVLAIVGGAQAWAQTYTYKLVDDGEIVDGGVYLLANTCEYGSSNAKKQQSIAMGEALTNNRKAVVVTISDDNKITLSTVNQSGAPYEVIAVKTADGFKFKLSNGSFLANRRTKKSNKGYNNYLKEADADAEGVVFSVVFKSSDKTFKLSNTYNNIESSLQLNVNAGNNQLVSCYGNTQTDPQLYRKVTSTSITDAGYSTYYGDDAFFMPTGVTGSVVVKDGEGIALKESYTKGALVPAKTALVLKATKGNYDFYLGSSDEVAPTDNLLHGTTTDALTNAGEGSYKYYKLSYDDNDENLGFYWSEENGAAFTNKAGKAYLALPVAEGQSMAKGYSLFDLANGTTTGIQQATIATAVAPIYDINGRRVSTLNGAAKGVYIVGGKKVMVK